MGKIYTSLMVAALVACVAGAAAQERQERHMHHHFPKDVDAFHSVLAPVWHARPGKERSQGACAKANEMERLGKDIRSGDAGSLLASVLALKKACEGNPADIDSALSDVHEAFHRLAEPQSAR